MQWWDETASTFRIAPSTGEVKPVDWDELAHRPPEDPSRQSEAADRSAQGDSEYEKDQRRAFDEGYRQGIEDGAREVETLYEQVVELAGLVRQIEEAVRDRESGVEERVRVLALAVARVLMEGEVKLEPAEVTRILRRALAVFPPDAPLEIRMNPRDLSALVQPAEGEEHAPSMGPESAIVWQAASDLGPGEIVINAPDRILDGRVIPILERIWEEWHENE
jgi:flagellar biosynthesis/type III secretory pathway protein FliH